jgi:hypothetical protein
MVRVLKFSKRIVVRRPFYPGIIDPDFFDGPQIVIYNHAPRANNGHFANFPRLEPTALDGGEAFAREEERHIRHVLYPGCDMSVSLAVYRDGRFAENIKNDRNVVRRQVPRDIDVLLEQSQVETPAINIADLA